MNKKLRNLRVKLIVLRHGLKVATTHEKKVIKRLSFIKTIKKLVHLEELIEKPKTLLKIRTLKSYNHKY